MAVAIAVPFAAIFSILGAIILFGQVRKWKRKRDKSKADKIAATKEAARLARLKADPRCIF